MARESLIEIHFVIKPRRNLGRPPFTHYDRGGLTVAEEPRVHTASQTQQLPPDDGDCKRTSVWNQKIMSKPITLLKLHRRRRGDEKPIFHGGTSGVTITNNISIDRLWTGDSPEMLQHLFRFYGAIGGINLEENSLNMMGAYELSEPLNHIIDQL